MKTATTLMVLTSLLAAAAGCSGDAGPGSSMSGTDGTDPNSMLPGAGPAGTDAVPGVSGTAAGPGVTPPAGPDGPVADPGPVATDGPADPAATDGPVAPPAPGDCSTIPATSQVPRLLNREYDNILRDLLGVTALADGNPPSSLLNADYDGPMDAIIWNAYQNAAATIASEVISGPNKSNFISCDPAAVATCYEDTIRAFGRKAFRRPMEDEDVARFMALTTIEPAGTPDEISEALLYAFLVSPSFIMVPEMSAEPEGDAIKLSSYEIATRLGLTLWGSVPDDELNAAADADQLQDPAMILQQAERMLQEPDKAGQQVAMAHRAFLVMDDNSHWFKISHDSTLFPNYSDSLRPTMQAELDDFFKDIAFNGGSFQDLFLSTTGFVNQDTAALYGLDPANFGPDLEKVDLPNRPGFLTRVGFLSSFSSDTVTSPILRGAFITVNMLGVNPGVPNPDNLKKPIPSRHVHHAS